MFCVFVCVLNILFVHIYTQSLKTAMNVVRIVAMMLSMTAQSNAAALSVLQGVMGRL